MKKFLAAASLLVSLSSAAHGVDEAPRVIPGSGDRNARFVIKGKKIDACRLAVEAQDAAQNRYVELLYQSCSQRHRLPADGRAWERH